MFGKLDFLIAFFDVVIRWILKSRFVLEAAI